MWVYTKIINNTITVQEVAVQRAMIIEKFRRGCKDFASAYGMCESFKETINNHGQYSATVETMEGNTLTMSASLTQHRLEI